MPQFYQPGKAIKAGRERALRKKYKQELKGVVKGVISVEYTDWCERYPALMTLAHHIVAKELMERKE
jgi:hypothetical protein